MRSSCRTDCIHISSVVASAMALYSTSVLDRDTVFCFLAHQDIKLGPKKIAKPPVDFLSSEQPAQSASENVLTRVEQDRRIWSPKLIVCLRKRSILLTTVQCMVVGEWRYWHTLFTENDISDRDKVRYRRAPTMVRYLVSSAGLRGVTVGLQCCILAQQRTSMAYFS
jgi:hypothetical protein